MWFKNIQLYQFEKPIAYQPEQLEEQLQHDLFKPCSALSPISAGFVAPISQTEEDPLVFAQQGYMCFCVKIQEKLLPPSVLREQHQIKVKEVEAKLGGRISRGERQRIKEELEHTLLTQAFSRSSYVYMFINTHTQQLVIDTCSNRKLQLIHKLINPLFALYYLAPYDLVSPSSVLTQWIRNKDYPASLSVLNRCTLQDIKTPKAKISMTHINVFDDNVEQLLDEQNHITQLRMNWEEKLNFTIKQDFSITQLQFMTEVKDLAKDGMSETEAERFAADFFVMAETLSQFIADFLPPFIDTEKNKNDKEKIKAEDALTV
jgi:recombination associated protein RdgC